MPIVHAFINVYQIQIRIFPYLPYLSKQKKIIALNTLSVTIFE